jgi:hypothetical protein
MTLEYVGVVALLIGIIGFFSRPSFIVYTFFCATLLGSAAAFVLDSLGGTNISPAHLLLGFLTLRIISDKPLSAQALQQISFGRPGFWLFLTVLYSIIGAYLLPRFLEGDTYIFAVRATVPFSIPLSPSTSNLTQSIYFAADFVCFVAISAYASTAGGTRVLVSAAVICAALNLVFGVLDLATYFTNTTELLLPIRNANYAMLVEAESAGLKRIAGSFTEASSYASATLAYFAFTGDLWLRGIKSRIMLSLALLSLCAVILSTSSTGYVGLAVLLVYSYVQAVLVALRRPTTIQTSSFILVTPVIAVILVAVIGFNESYSIYIQYLLDSTLFNKLSTASGVERSAWNSQALQNFFDTFGLGVGNGSARASSFPIAVLANLGVIGALIFACFFATLFFSQRGKDRPDVVEDAYRQAAKMACLSILITATISGALVDLGLSFYIFAAICSAKRSPVAVSGPMLGSSPLANRGRRLLLPRQPCDTDRTRMDVTGSVGVPSTG